MIIDKLIACASVWCAVFFIRRSEWWSAPLGVLCLIGGIIRIAETVHRLK